MTCNYNGLSSRNPRFTGNHQRLLRSQCIPLDVQDICFCKSGRQERNIECCLTDPPTGRLVRGPQRPIPQPRHLTS